MIDDARRIPPGRTLECDVCVVGSGPAGIALAKSLRPNLAVCVLESGGFEPEEKTQALYQGKIVGREYFPLDQCRQRFFGGSTNCWAGLCRPLDSTDFEAREWIPYSGWPFSLADLDRYYARAQDLLFLGPYEYTPERWAQGRNQPFVFRADSDLRSGVLQVNGGTTRIWGRTYRRELEQSKNVRVLLWANVTEIALDANGRSVQHLIVKVIDGPIFFVRARHYVLALGGIENPRLLLASRSVQPAGVGNDRDLVGRFFMEHPHTDREGLFLGTGGAPNARFYLPFTTDSGNRELGIWGYLAATPEAQQRERILSFAVMFLAFEDLSERADVPALARAVGGLEFSDLESRVKEILGELAPKRIAARLSLSPLLAWLGTPSEQAPNPDSRVLLDTATDALGMPKVKLDWRLSEIDKYTIRRAYAMIGRELGAAGLGRLNHTLIDDDQTWSRRTAGGRHHMGTTRMHDDPSKGVVDRHGLVHGMPNLSIAGSSLFPTSGSANPTLTVVALAVRMGERLSEQLTP